MARKNYTEEQKKSAVDKVKEVGVNKASKELGISTSTLTAWSKAQVTPEKEEVPKKDVTPVKKTTATVKKTRKSRKGSPEVKRLEELEKENRELSTLNMKLKAERDQLKKAIRDIIS